MRSIFQVAFIAALSGAGCMANAFQATPPAVRMEKGSILYAELSRTLDAKKAKAGDPVTAQLLADVLSHGKIVVRRDSKLVGHVTEAQARTKENPESRLGIVFDKVVLKGGQEVPFSSVLLALRPALRPVFDVPSGPTPPGANPAAGPAPERHYPSPQGSSPKLNTPMNGELQARDQEMSGLATTDIDGLSLNSSVGNGQAIVSNSKTIKLESGVRLELRVTDQHP